MFHTNADGGHSPPSVKSIYPHETLRAHQAPSLRFSLSMNYLVDCKACPTHLTKQNHHKGTWPLCGGNSVCPDKTYQNKPVPFWQVQRQALKVVLDEVADGSGVVDVDGSGREAGVEGLTRQGLIAGKGQRVTVDQVERALAA